MQKPNRTKLKQYQMTEIQMSRTRNAVIRTSPVFSGEDPESMRCGVRYGVWNCHGTCRKSKVPYFYFKIINKCATLFSSDKHPEINAVYMRCVYTTQVLLK